VTAIPAACLESCGRMRLHCTVQSFLGYSGGEDTHSQHRRRAGQRSGGARFHLRPPINAAIFLSIRGLGSGRVGTQPNTLNWGKGRLLF
jgi:hypothetical protein